MVKGFVIAGLLSGGFILLFSSVGLYARAFGLEGSAAVAVPVALGLPLLLVFNAIMLASAGSTLDSTFASTAKLTARDWPNAGAEATERPFWTGLSLGVLMTIESATGIDIFPGWIDIGSGRYADDLSVNVYGLLACTAGYLLGTLPYSVRRLAPQAS